MRTWLGDDTFLTCLTWCFSSSIVSASFPWALLASPPCPQRTQVHPCTCPWPRRCPWGLWAPPWPISPWDSCTHRAPPCCWTGALTPLPGWAQVALPASRRRPPGAPRVSPRCPSHPAPPSCCPRARGASWGGLGAPSASGEGPPRFGGPPPVSTSPQVPALGLGSPRGTPAPQVTPVVTGEGFGQLGGPGGVIHKWECAQPRPTLIYTALIN
ncbi:hypothetical protein DV515_00016668 [Chloebia gouldiae]|uniref:Uncharacterized protein n=1 Tax=Chloebia gouldiae TaxID=44316 RepID=A0A3L8RS34_CHLGU|nr:hypothetical protein DV515_00016668 [Chloebia gouldiae]